MYIYGKRYYIKHITKVNNKNYEEKGTADATVVSSGDSSGRDSGRAGNVHGLKRCFHPSQKMSV